MADWMGEHFGIEVESAVGERIRFVSHGHPDMHADIPEFAFLEGAVEGFDDATTETTYRENARVAGGALTLLRTPTREIWWPVFFDGTDLAEMREARKLWRRISSPLDEVTIRVVWADGSTRWIKARAKKTAPTWGAGEFSLDGWQTLGARFVAADPWWHSDASTLTYQLNRADAKPFFPILPLKLQSPIAGGVQYPVDIGDVPAFAEYRITGPAGSVTAEQGGRSWTLTHPIDPGATVVIYTSPYRTDFTVRGADGSEWWRYMEPGADLFPIAPNSGLTVRIDGATVDTSAEVIITPNWEGIL